MNPRLFSLLLLLACTGGIYLWANRPFSPPNEAARLAAVGNIDGMTGSWKKALVPDPEFFTPMGEPQSGDWLGQHPEKGQTFAQFVANPGPKPDAIRTTLYFQPMGTFSEAAKPFLAKLQGYGEAFFQMKVMVNAPIPMEEVGATSRMNQGREQRLTKDILQWMRQKIPKDAYAVLAVTLVDLYPEPSWNFVFGQATLADRVGVFSLARYDPAFFGEERGADYTELYLRRSVQVLAHEAVHMFGIRHCIHFQCAMNGSNNQAESDRTPLHLCPVCLRKLHHQLNFDVVKREEALQKWYAGHNLTLDAEWSRKRLEKIR